MLAVAWSISLRAWSISVRALALFVSRWVEPVFQAGDQAGRVGFREIARGKGDFGAGGAVEG
jgi:hypothetical protein